jgi:hypothetical protein
MYIVVDGLLSRFLLGLVLSVTATRKKQSVLLTVGST